MLNYKNLCILGTSHIARESIEEIKQFVEKETPDLIAIELDKQRLYALLNNVKSKVKFSDIRQIGFKGFLFAVFGGWAQKKLGNIVKVKPGSEMKIAAQLAFKNKIQLALIDQNITVTLKRFSKSFGWKERFRFVADMFKFVIFRKREMKRLGIVNLDLRIVPEEKIIKKLIKEMKSRYPSVYKVLIDDRNKYMARNLAVLMEQFPEKKIFAVVGAGHTDELMKLVKKKYSKKKNN